MAEYEQEIEALYRAVDESSQSHIPPPSSWDQESSLRFIQSVVNTVLKNNKLGVEDDMFQHGCDSLQATWIRNTLLRAVRQSEVDTRSATANFVYQHPTIKALAGYVSRLVLGSDDGANLGEEEKVKAMKDMVTKYSSSFPALAARKPTSSRSGKVVLLTGTTGGLGSNVLASLLEDEGVEKVYALNRKDANESLDSRMAGALSERGLERHVTALTSEKVVLLEGDTALDALGLGEQVYDEVSKQLLCRGITL